MTARAALCALFACALCSLIAASETAPQKSPGLPAPVGGQALAARQAPGPKVNFSVGSPSAVVPESSPQKPREVPTPVDVQTLAGKPAPNATLQAAAIPTAYPSEEQCFRYCNNIGRKWWWCRWDACACYEDRSDAGSCYGDTCTERCPIGQYGWCLWGRCMCLKDLYTYKGMKC